MLTRLKVSGFKNLVDVDVRFGPFTCVAGANGVGKSNLFDAIVTTALEPICATIAPAIKFEFAPDYLIADAFLNFNTKE